MIYLTRVPPGEDLHKAAWALLSYAVAGALPPVRFGPYGKPCFAGGPFFSLSHTRGLALCAVEDWETGVDAEYRRTFSPRLQGRVFTEAERAAALASSDPMGAFTALWTQKECCMKYTGLGLSGGIPNISNSGLCFRTIWWEGYAISQCGPAPFEMALRPVEF